VFVASKLWIGRSDIIVMYLSAIHDHHILILCSSAPELVSLLSELKEAQEELRAIGQLNNQVNYCYSLPDPFSCLLFLIAFHE
jgi:hypothetical protein